MFDAVDVEEKKGGNKNVVLGRSHVRKEEKNSVTKGAIVIVLMNAVKSDILNISHFDAAAQSIV